MHTQVQVWFTPSEFCARCRATSSEGVWGAEGLRANASGRWTRGGMAARGTAPELGARLSLDDFLIEKELARTQAGTVYKAKHGRSGKMVVLKARRSAEIGRDGSIEHEVR